MEIRFATKADMRSAVRSIQNKKIDYNTTAQIKEDIQQARLVVAEENGKLLGSCALVPDERGYIAVKRVCVYNKRYQGKGVAGALIDFVCSLGLGDLGATPWNINPTMCHVFEKSGFKYQYTFNETWCFYLRKGEN